MIFVGTGVTWPVVSVLALLFLVICFLAVLWSKREWNSRNVRIGMFLEREYKTDEDDVPPDDDDAPTQEWPRRDE